MRSRASCGLKSPEMARSTARITNAGIPRASYNRRKIAEYGTTTSWLADNSIFSELDYDFETLAQRFREVAYLTKGLWISFVDERQELETNFYFEGGIQSFVRHINIERVAVNKTPFYVERRVGDTTVEVAMQYNDGFSEATFSFANAVNTVDGGSHLTGFRAALTRVINEYARKQKILKDDDANLTGDDVRKALSRPLACGSSSHNSRARRRETR